jgi:hypothetical protein
MFGSSSTIMTRSGVLSDGSDIRLTFPHFVCQNAFAAGASASQANSPINRFRHVAPMRNK